MVAYWYENFACEMSALLAAMELVLEVYACSSVLREELCQLDDC